MNVKLSEYMMEMIVLIIVLLLGSAWIFISLTNPEDFVKSRHAWIINAILGQEDTIKVLRFIGKISLIIGTGMFLIALFTYLFGL